MVNKDLPHGLLPDPSSALLPPTYCFGWVFSDSQIVSLSKKYDIAVFNPVGSDDPDDVDWRAVDDYQVSLGVAPNFDIVFTSAAVAEYVLKEVGVVIPFKDPLNVVYRSDGPYIAVVLCDNYHYPCKPTEGQVRKLQEMFGFSEGPTWMLDTHNSDWSEKAKGSRPRPSVPNATPRQVDPRPQQLYQTPHVHQGMAIVTADCHPRRGPEHLGERRAGFKDLPRSLLPDSDNALLPPTYYLGWVFDDRQIVPLSKKYNIAVYNLENYDCDFDDDDDPDGRAVADYQISLGAEPNLNIVFTGAAVAERLLGEAGVVIPLKDPLNVVFGPKGVGACIAVVICDNYHYDSRPNEAQVCRLQELFGFEEEATWMLDTHNPDWSCRDVHGRVM